MADLRHGVGGNAATEAIFTPHGLVSRALRVEVALAQGCGEAGLIAPPVVDRLVAASAHLSPDEAARVVADGHRSGTPVLPLLDLVRSRLDPDDAPYLHWGATSQDIVDTALVLQVRDGIDALQDDLLQTGRRSAHLADRHRATPMPGRTLLRHAVPISFGLKAARWVAATTRSWHALEHARSHLALQLGGAAGTARPWGDAAAAVEAAVGRHLGLAPSDVPWHAERDRLGHIVATVGVVTAVLEKVANDLLLLSVEEVGEITFGSGGGTSSAMPNKDNPTDAVLAVTAGRLARGAVATYLSLMDHEHERAAGAWQAEAIVVSDAFRGAGACAHHLARAVDRVEVDPPKMSADLRLRGAASFAEALVTALEPALGPGPAREKVADLLRRSSAAGQALDRAAADDPDVTATGIDLVAVFDPVAQLGSADRFVDRALAAHRAIVAAQRTGPTP